MINLINTQEKVSNRKLIQMIACFKKQQNTKNQMVADLQKEQKVKKVLSFYNELKKFSDDKIGLFLRQSI